MAMRVAVVFLLAAGVLAVPGDFLAGVDEFSPERALSSDNETVDVNTTSTEMEEATTTTEAETTTTEEANATTTTEVATTAASAQAAVTASFACAAAGLLYSTSL